MEDMEAQESQGVDITGIVDWDDGLTNKERARGGRTVFELEKRSNEVFRKSLVDAGHVEALESVVKRGKEGVESGKGEGVVEEEVVQELAQQPQKRKVKRWLGIWE